MACPRTHTTWPIWASNCRRAVAVPQPDQQTLAQVCSQHQVKHRLNSIITFTLKAIPLIIPIRPRTWHRTWVTTWAIILATRLVISYFAANTSSTQPRTQRHRRAGWDCSRRCTTVQLPPCNSFHTIRVNIPWRPATIPVTIRRTRGYRLLIIST